jgi:hypothetical protein
MPAHDIIDSRNEKLIDHFSQMLDSSERARFAVGYLFLPRERKQPGIWNGQRRCSGG